MLHTTFIAAGPLIHRDKLEGAVAAPYAGTFDVEFYPTIAQKATKLVDGISRAQAFRDGNKRLAWLSMTTFVEMNGLVVDLMPAEEAARWVLDLDGTDGLIRATEWLNEHLRSTY